MTRSTPLEYAVGRAATMHARATVDEPWQELPVTNVRMSLADRFVNSQAAPAPLTAWQQVKLRHAFVQALLLARWVMVHR